MGSPTSCFWHKADMLNALTNVCRWAQGRHSTNRCLPISIMGTQPSLASISGPRACFLRLSRTLREPGCRFFQGGTVRWK